jgi:hypothetical protein
MIDFVYNEEHTYASFLLMQLLLVALVPRKLMIFYVSIVSIALYYHISFYPTSFERIFRGGKGG